LQARGWNTKVLTEADAREHPEFTSLYLAFRQMPTVGTEAGFDIAHEPYPRRPLRLMIYACVWMCLFVGKQQGH